MRYQYPTCFSFDGLPVIWYRYFLELGLFVVFFLFTWPSKGKHVIHFAKVRLIMRSWDQNILSAWHSQTMSNIPVGSFSLLPIFSISFIRSLLRSTVIKTSSDRRRRSVVLHRWEPVSWQRAHRLRTNTSEEAWVTLGLWNVFGGGFTSTAREERKNPTVDL